MPSRRSRGLAARARRPAPPSSAAQPVGKARSSRLWAALERFAASPRAKKLQAFSERFEAKPLVEINLAKTAKGWALKDVKLSPTFGFKQFTVKTGAAGKPAAPASAGNAAAPPAGGVQAAAENGGAPPVAAAGAGGPPQPAPPSPGAAQQSAPPPRSDSP